METPPDNDKTSISVEEGLKSGPSSEQKLDLLAEMVAFIMNSVMVPRKVERKVLRPGDQPSQTVLIPLSVSWNALKEVERRIAAEKAALLTPSE